MNECELEKIKDDLESFRWSGNLSFAAATELEGIIEDLEDVLSECRKGE